SVHATLKGKGNAPSVMIAAHMDEVGLMVTYISEEGFLSVAAVGGVDAAILPGMRVDVHTKQGTLRGVVGRKPIHLISPDERKNVTALDDLVIDLGMSAKHVKKAVSIGDVITYGVGFEDFGDGMAVSRGFDDKMGVYIAVRARRAAKAGGRQAITSVQRSGGSGCVVEPPLPMGFTPISRSRSMSRMLRIIWRDPTKYGKLACGEGRSSRGPNINPIVFDRERPLKAKVPARSEAEPRVTELMQLRCRSSVAEGNWPRFGRAALYAYSHQVIAWDLEACVKLLVQFILDLDEEVTFVLDCSHVARRYAHSEESSCAARYEILETTRRASCHGY
ncbi:MAG: hypothetical protein ACLTW2_00520, partial [Eggerthellaceae bacterium]